MQRRLLLKGSLIGGQIALLGGAGLLLPTRVRADWPADAFYAEHLHQAISVLTDNAPVTSSGSVVLEAEDIAENGAIVPVTVRSRLPGTRALFLFSEKNPSPAVAQFHLSPRVEPLVRTRIKMAESGKVIAIVKADGGYFSATKHIRVTAGGCA